MTNGRQDIVNKERPRVGSGYFRVDGADLETGEESYLILQAPSVTEAESVARKQGLLIAGVRVASSDDWRVAPGVKTPIPPQRVMERVITFEPIGARPLAKVHAPDESPLAEDELLALKDVSPISEFESPKSAPVAEFVAAPEVQPAARVLESNAEVQTNAESIVTAESALPSLTDMQAMDKWPSATPKAPDTSPKADVESTTLLYDQLLEVAARLSAAKPQMADAPTLPLLTDERLEAQPVEPESVGSGPELSISSPDLADVIKSASISLEPLNEVASEPHSPLLKFSEASLQSGDFEPHSDPAAPEHSIPPAVLPEPEWDVEALETLPEVESDPDSALALVETLLISPTDIKIEELSALIPIEPEIEIAAISPPEFVTVPVPLPKLELEPESSEPELTEAALEPAQSAVENVEAAITDPQIPLQTEIELYQESDALIAEVLETVPEAESPEPEPEQAALLTTAPSTENLEAIEAAPTIPPPTELEFAQETDTEIAETADALAEIAPIEPDPTFSPLPSDEAIQTPQSEEYVSSEKIAAIPTNQVDAQPALESQSLELLEPVPDVKSVEAEFNLQVSAPMPAPITPIERQATSVSTPPVSAEPNPALPMTGSPSGEIRELSRRRASVFADAVLSSEVKSWLASKPQEEFLAMASASPGATEPKSELTALPPTISPVDVDNIPAVSSETRLRSQAAVIASFRPKIVATGQPATVITPVPPKLNSIWPVSTASRETTVIAARAVPEEPAVTTSSQSLAAIDEDAIDQFFRKNIGPPVAERASDPVPSATAARPPIPVAEPTPSTRIPASPEPVQKPDKTTSESSTPPANPPASEPAKTRKPTVSTVEPKVAAVTRAPTRAATQRRPVAAPRPEPEKSRIVEYALIALASISTIGGIALMIIGLLLRGPFAPTEIEKLDFRIRVLTTTLMGGVVMMAGLLIWVIVALIQTLRAVKRHTVR